MKYAIHWIDVTENLTTQQQPVFLLERPLAHGSHAKGHLFNVAEVARLGTYWTPTSDLNTDPVRWSKTASGQYVRIPVFGYRTRQSAEAAIFGMAIQLGITALASLQQQVNVPILSTYLVLGHQVHHLGPEGYRGYLGLAFQTKE